VDSGVGSGAVSRATLFMTLYMRGRRPGRIFPEHDTIEGPRLRRD